LGFVFTVAMRGWFRATSLRRKGALAGYLIF
jgi:hypothetical protein